MARHPLHDVAIVGVHNTRQARLLPDYTSKTIMLEAVDGALAEAGLTRKDLDGVNITLGAGGGQAGNAFAYESGFGPVWVGSRMIGAPAVLEAAAAIAIGECTTVVLAAGQVGVYTEREATAPWTRPENEFVASYGLFTAAEFALIARRHMYLYGTTPEQLATVASTIRNNGHRNPEAVYYGRGPFTPQDILDSRMVADPFHLLDCAMTSEGGTAMVLTTRERARDLKGKPVYVLGGGEDSFGPAYQHPPAFDLTGWVGETAAKRAFAMAGIGPDDVDTCEFYDPFSFEIIRQFEAFGFCPKGEGGEYIMSGVIGPEGRHPICTDGGLMSFAHAGMGQMLQRIIQGVRQVRGDAPNQMAGAKVAMASNGGAGALFNHLILVGSEPA